MIENDDIKALRASLGFTEDQLTRVLDRLEAAEAEVQRLTAENEALRRDAARIDGLAAQMDNRGFGEWVVKIVIDGSRMVRPTAGDVRASIDALAQAEKGEAR